MLGLSVIVPIYNTKEAMLQQCFHSFTYLLSKINEIPLEIILVNDGSTEKKTTACCEQFAKKFSNVYYIYQTNSGVSSARNKGVRKAKYSHCMFVDPDDYLKIEENFSLDFLKTQQDLYFFPYGIFSDENTSLKKMTSFQTKHLTKEKFLRSQLHLDEYFYEGIESFYVSTCWGKIYSKTKLLEIGPFQVDIHKREDMLFLAEYFQQIETYACLFNLTYGYRISQENSLSKKYSASLWDNYQKLFVRLTKVLPVEYQEDLYLYFFNLFHEGLVLDLFHSKNKLTWSNKKKKMESFYSLLTKLPQPKKKSIFKQLPFSKKLLYSLIYHRLFLIIRFLFIIKTKLRSN